MNKFYKKYKNSVIVDVIDNKAIMLAKVEQDGNALYYASDTLRDDPKIRYIADQRAFFT